MHTKNYNNVVFWKTTFGHLFMFCWLLFVFQPLNKLEAKELMIQYKHADEDAQVEY
jgi:hypothetical protein